MRKGAVTKSRENQSKGASHTNTTKPGGETSDQEREIITAMFIPGTPGSRLRRMLQSKDDLFAKLHNTSSVRMVENGGVKLSALLCKADP